MATHRMGWARWRAALWVVGCVWLVVLADGVAAHAELQETFPAAGAALVDTPAEIRLVFNGELSPGSTFALFAGDFEAVLITVAIEADDARQLVGRPPDLAAGIYTVQWLSINSDGHSLQGTYSFTIGDEQMLETVALAQAAAFNPPAWAGWLMVILALGLPTLAALWLRSRR